MLRYENAHEHHGHRAKAAVLYRAFKDRLGTCVPTTNPLNLQQLLQPLDDLTERLSLRRTLTELSNRCLQTNHLDLMVLMLPSLKTVGISLPLISISLLKTSIQAR